MQVRVLPGQPFLNGSVAQLVEHLPEEQGVVGAIPTRPTNLSPHRLMARTSGFHPEDCRFESGWGRHVKPGTPLLHAHLVGSFFYVSGLFLVYIPGSAGNLSKGNFPCAGIWKS